MLHAQSNGIFNGADLTTIRSATSLQVHTTDLISLLRHGYHNSSNNAPTKGVADLKLHLGNSSSSSLHSTDPVVIHPGAALAMLDLLASVSSDTQPEVRSP